MATIVLNRTSEFVNRMRGYSVYIDGNNFGKISDGETRRFTVPAGSHSVLLTIDWCSSPEMQVELKDDEVRTLTVGGFKHGYWLMPLAFFLIILGYIFHQYYGFDYVFYLAIPVVFLLAYYLTIGRKRYLTISEVARDKATSVALP